MLMEWMLMPLKRYAEFSGRSRRKEYWMYTLFIVIVSIVLSILDRMLGLGGSSSLATETSGAGAGIGAATHTGVLGGIFMLATFIPSLAVAIRRLHDSDRAGWWVLVGFGPYLLAIALMVVGVMTGQLGLLATGGLLMMIGFVGAIVLLVFMCLPGTSGPNKYGPDPLDPSGAELGEVFS
jgi:uncharacterized membrane protein YhaH (DUF805 family)